VKESNLITLRVKLVPEGASARGIAIALEKAEAHRIITNNPTTKIGNKEFRTLPAHLTPRPKGM